MTFERRILTTYDASTAGFDRGTRRVESALARLQRTTEQRLSTIDHRFERASRSALRAGTAIGALIGVTTGANVIQGLHGFAEAWRLVERSLVAAGFAAEGNQEKIALLAVRARADFTNIGNVVSRLARATGGDLDASIRRVETLQKLLAVGGATTTEQGSTLLQFSQAVRAGRLSGDEFRAISENAPTELLDALARRAGATRAELKEFGAEGKLTAKVMLDALDDLVTTADKKFAQLSITTGEAFRVMSTGLAVFLGQMDESIGVTATLNDFLVDMGAFLIDNAESAATFAKALEIAALAAASLAGGRALGAVRGALIASADARAAEVQRLQQSVIESRNVATAKAAEAKARRDNVAAIQREATVARVARRREAVAKIREVNAETGALRRDETLAAAGATVTRGAGGRFVSLQNVIRDRRANVAVLEAEAEALRRANVEQVNLDASSRRLENARRRLARAEQVAAAAAGQAATASNALAIAQTRVAQAASLASVAWRGASTAFSGMLAFFGGWPGLIFAAVTMMALFSDSLFAAGSAADRAQEGLNEVSDSIEKVQVAEQRIKDDTDALADAHGRLEEAIRAQQPAAEATARVEIAAIQRRIQANEELKESYAANAQARLASVEKELEAAQREFEREFGSSALRQTVEALFVAGQAPTGRGGEIAAEQRARAAREADAAYDAAVARQRAGTPDDGDEEILSKAARLKELTAQQAALREELGLGTKAEGEFGSAIEQTTETILNQSEAIEEIGKEIASLASEARRLRLIRDLGEELGEITAKLAEQELKLLGEGFSPTEAAVQLKELRDRLFEVKALKDELAEPKKIELVGDVSADIGRLDDEARALRGGPEALEAYREGAERADYLAQVEKQLADALGETDAALLQRAEIMALVTASYDDWTAATKEAAAADLYAEAADEIHRLGEEAQALEGGEDAVRAFNEEFARTEFIEQWRERLAAVIKDQGELKGVLDLLTQAFDDNRKAQEDTARSDALDEATEKIAEMRAEAVAMKDGEAAFAAFREEGEKQQFLDSFEDRLRTAGYEGVELENILRELSGAWYDLRDAANSVAFGAAIQGIEDRIAEARSRTAAAQAAVSAGDKSILEAHDAQARVNAELRSEGRALSGVAGSEADDAAAARLLGELREERQRALESDEAVAAIPSDRKRGGGGRSRKSDAEKDAEDAKEAYDDLIASAAERQIQLRDEIELEQARGTAIELTRAHAVEMEYLAEKQSYLAEARRAELEITEELEQKAHEHAQAYAETTVEIDSMTAARQLLQEVAEEEMTVEEKILAMRERTAELLPEITALIGDEAKAREGLAQGQELQAEDIREANRETSDWADGISRAITNVKSLDEAFNNLLNTFIELAASDFFNALFGVEPEKGKKSSPFAMIGQIAAKAIGSYLGGGSGFGSLATTGFGGIKIDPNLRFASGGWTGGRENQIRGVVHGEEFVIRAGPAKRYLPLLEAINNIPGFASGGFVSPSLPPIPITPTVPRFAGARSAGEMIDASMTVNIDKPGASAAEILRLLEPRLAKHQQETIGKVKRRHRLDPSFLEE